MKIRNKDFTLKIKGLIFNKKIINELKNYNFTIYWNDLECYYWIFDFKINNIWFSSYKIDMDNKIIYLQKWGFNTHFYFCFLLYKS